MGLQIIDADQPLEVDSLIVVLYGQPGIGKTSLSFRSTGAFLLDFDTGLQRSVKRGKAARVDSWSDAVEFYQQGKIQELGIKTLIVDTIGTMLDNYIARQVVLDDNRNGKKDGSLAIQGYGAMKNVFNSFVNFMKKEKVDLIFIAHDDEHDDGGQTKKKPKITGGSYDIIKGAADLMGYVCMDNGNRVLDFNPTDNYVGKNSAEFPKLIIPHYSDPTYDNFMGDIIQKCKDKMNALSEEMVIAQSQVDEFRVFIGNCDGIDELEMLRDNIDNGLSQTYKIQVDKIYYDKLLEIIKLIGSEIKGTEGMSDFMSHSSKFPSTYVNAFRSEVRMHMDRLNLTYDKSDGTLKEKS